MKRIVVAVCALALCAQLCAVSASASVLGPSPYLSFTDSPYSGGSFDWFYLEDFEDGALNTPGASGTGIVNNPALSTDSVDFDDGVFDGLGQQAHSWYSNFDTEITFSFDDNVLGAFPTHVGIVWTDVGQTTNDTQGIGEVVVEAFDENSTSLGTIAATLGDGSIFGQTPEDRFFGFVNSPGGISSIVLTMITSIDWEVDHLQYGYEVPEPTTALLLAGLGMLAIRRR